MDQKMVTNWGVPLSSAWEKGPELLDISYMISYHYETKHLGIFLCLSIL